MNHCERLFKSDMGETNNSRPVATSCKMLHGAVWFHRCAFAQLHESAGVRQRCGILLHRHSAQLATA